MKWWRVKNLTREVIGGAAMVGILTGIGVHLNGETYLIEYAKAEKVVSVEPIEVEVKLEVHYSIEKVQEIYKEAAARYGVSESKMLVTMRCESRGGVYNIQSEHKYTFSDPVRGIYFGGREMSYGPSQIHLPDHPYVTYEQAIDPYFAADFMAKAFASGNANWWTCYRMNY